MLAARMPPKTEECLYVDDEDTTIGGGVSVIVRYFKKIIFCHTRYGQQLFCVIHFTK